MTARGQTHDLLALLALCRQGRRRARGREHTGVRERLEGRRSELQAGQNLTAEPKPRGFTPARARGGAAAAGPKQSVDQSTNQSVNQSTKQKHMHLLVLARRRVVHGHAAVALAVRVRLGVRVHLHKISA